jgi:hypothetical protein
MPHSHDARGVTLGHAADADPDDRTADPGDAFDETQETTLNFIRDHETSDNPMARNAALILRTRFNAFVELNKRNAEQSRHYERDQLLRHLFKTKAAATVADELFQYETRNWPHDKRRSNPYMKDDPRHTFYRILTLRRPGDAVLTRSTLERMQRRWRAQQSGAD